MRLFRRPDHPPVGLEIGSGGVRILQLHTGPDGSTRATQAARPLPASEQLRPTADFARIENLRAAAGLASQMLIELRHARRRVVTCLPEGAVQLRTLRIPAKPGDAPPDSARLEIEAGSLFGSDVRASRTQYLYAGVTRHGSGPAHEFYVAASPSRLIESFVAELDRAGIEIEAIDLAPCAVFRAIERKYAGTQAIHAIAEIAGRQTQVIIGEAGRIRLIRPIPIGTTQLCQAISRRLGISADEAGQLRRRLLDEKNAAVPDREPVRNAVRQACRGVIESLAAEIALSLRYHQVAFRGSQPNQILVCGAESHDPQLVSMLTDATGLNAAPVQLFGGLDLRRAAIGTLAPSPTEWALPLGLALRSQTRTLATQSRAA